MQLKQLEQLARLIRYYILLSSTTAGSGHPTSSLSATDLMTTLFFKYLHYDLDNPDRPDNDRVIFSKGHASPLFYALYAAAGKISEAELLKYRTFESVLEGHPTPRFKYTEVPTGSLGQGLSVGVGEALALRDQVQSSKFKVQSEKDIANDSEQARKTKNIPHVYVLLGDGEMAEGSVWEAIQTASHYKLKNLVAILDVNRLGQSGPTMLQHDLETYQERVSSFGWNTVVVEDGHDIEQIDKAFAQVQSSKFKVQSEKGESSQLSSNNRSQPIMIIAKTIKGKGVSILEDKNGWHGKPLAKEDLVVALKELGEVDKKLRGIIQKPLWSLRAQAKQSQIWNQVGDNNKIASSSSIPRNDELTTDYKLGEEVATRKAFGTAVAKLGRLDSRIVVLDADVQNSTYTEIFGKENPDRFFQLYIGEQNMLGVATGMARRGKRVFLATFASFVTRAHDQIRMAALGQAHLVINGSHAGVSIGEDGPSQMGLEDLSLFRTVIGSSVFYPADAVATEKLVELADLQPGIVYIRTTRPATKVIYGNEEEFEIGGSKEFKVQSSKLKEKITLVAAGVTLFEALKAAEQLKSEGIAVRVIDCYCLKPIDVGTLKKAARETQAIITVEDHYPEGGLGDAVLAALADQPHVPVYKLAVGKIPRSGKPQELFDFEGISAKAIIEQVKKILK